LTAVALDRRRFLQAGGGALFAAALAACTKSKPKAQPGATTTTTVTSTTAPGPTASDITLIRTAASLEALAVSVYQRAAAANLLKDPAALDATTLFLSHHMAHLQAMNALLTATEQQAVTDPNPAIEKVFKPALAAARTQDDMVELLFTLEDAIGQTYVYAAGLLTTPEHRTTIMTVAGVHARQRALLGVVYGHHDPADLFPSSFARNDNPLPPDALLT
jgi:hypothetical protein